MIITNPKLPASVIEMAARRLKLSASELTIAQLTGDASARTYFRIKSKVSSELSIIVALYGEPFDESERACDRLARLEQINPAARLVFANDPCAHIEVTELLIEAGLRVPRITDACGKDAALLIEDVGDMRLQDWLADRTQAELIDVYQHAVSLIVKIQEATELALRANSICSQLAFDEAKLGWELDFFFTHYFGSYLGLSPDSHIVHGVKEEFKLLCQKLAARPRVLTHRDYHARNLMLHRGELFIIDHQDARMGPASYDLASLLADPYSALDRTIASEMVEYFIELKSKSAVPLADVEEFRTEYQLMLVQRMLKAIGTYAYQAAVMNNPTYLPYIESATRSALRAMTALGGFNRTCALLEEAQGVGSSSV
jgi:aminoglycoside/choline kinase family phosphotransferase